MGADKSKDILAELKLCRIVFLVNTIKRNPGITGIKISKQKNIRNLYLILKQLEKKRIVKIKPTGKDKKIYITKKGLVVLNTLKKII